jgi:hypothetical protein
MTIYRNEALQDDIAQARAELGSTLQELMARADVRSRARASASRTALRARAALRSPTPWLALATGVAAMAILARWTRRGDARWTRRRESRWTGRRYW